MVRENCVCVCAIAWMRKSCAYPVMGPGNEKVECISWKGLWLPYRTVASLFGVSKIPNAVVLTGCLTLLVAIFM